MSFFMKWIAVLIFTFNTLNVYAGDGGASPNQPSQDVKNLLEQFHEDIEHSEQSEGSRKLNAVLTQWLANFNLARISLDVHRSVQMKYYQDGGKSEYIKNFPVLASFYFLSHATEVLSGPMGVYMASELGMGSAAKMVIGTVGAIITVPGLDPLCILLFAVSPLKPVQKAFTGIRLVAVKLSGGISNKLHLKQAMARIFESRDRLSEIVKASQETESYLRFNFKTVDGKTWVESLEILDVEELQRNKKSLDRILRQFNISARYALQRAIRNPRKTFYTGAVSTEGPSTKIEFKDYALMVKPRIALKTKTQNETSACLGLFQ